jgi:uncharacterized protein YecE (DUF72 family)
MTLQLYVGRTHLHGAITKYSARFRMLELRAEVGRLPRSSVLRRWSETVSAPFVFSVLLSPDIGRLTGDQDSALDFALRTAEALDARWFVIQTDPTVGPSRRSRHRLAMLVSRLRETGRRIAWEPHGVWRDDEAAALTRDLGIYLVRDISRGEPGNGAVVYSRIPALGTSARLSEVALDNTARSVMGASEAYVVVGGEGATRVQQHLTTLAGRQEPPSVRSECTPGTVDVFGSPVPRRAIDDSIAVGDADEGAGQGVALPRS